ncbi:hypothetical protein QMK33_06555 [Hymenobacter sp. H14-R3]|uniref:hypothetical protein n=1 Tax=Hymenobacter sp. H14-R3 TaxID=3046308 RepID=UPI0024B9CDE9|nr:hypothetical protein [Hymenobacter sp. H14-R3]MDJ0364807.1 hypothetical protein [Hymenobacter sp. H14-R3]
MRNLYKVGTPRSDTIADGRLRYYSVHYQATPPLIRGTVRHPLSATEMTEACEMILEHAQRHNCPYWLLDGRADASGRPTDVYEWLAEEFLPRVHRTLGRVPCLAFIAQAEFWQELRAHHYAPPTAALQLATYRAGWFVDETTAQAWLNQFRPALGYKR